MRTCKQAASLTPRCEAMSLGMPRFPNLPLWFTLNVLDKQGRVSPLGHVHSSEGQESKCYLPERVFFQVKPAAQLAFYFAWSESEESSGSDPEGEAFSAKVAFLKNWPKGRRKGVQMPFLSLCNGYLKHLT